VLLRGVEAQLEEDVVVIDDIAERRESSVVKVAALVRRLHEETVFAHEEPGEVHRLVRMIRRAIGLEAVDADLGWLVQIPAGVRP
jgi:hypothetical protein